MADLMDGDLLPARMINEFVYCPRLFYLEWVEARFADNDDTRLGSRYIVGSTLRLARRRYRRRASCAGHAR